MTVFLTEEYIESTKRRPFDLTAFSLLEKAENRIGKLELALAEARRWIENNDDLSDNGAEYVLKRIREALED